MAEPIAVIGLGCRFPGAPGPDAYWELLRNGVDAIGEVPAARWDVNAYYDPRAATPGRMSTRWGGFLADVDRFDAPFFGISAREARAMDPQQRLVLEVAWEALEDAGQAPSRLTGSQTGVFLGVSSADYTLLHEVTRDLSKIDPYYGTGTGLGFTAGRLSYVLGLEGPSLVVDTACSSSLVAVHLACQSLRAGECDLAIAGGVNLVLSPVGGIYVSQVGAVAPDGRCKAFDAGANGYVRAEGCGLVVLKRWPDAVHARDTVSALLLGSAVNQDGRSAGLTVPSGSAQQNVIARALACAGVSPSTIDYVEAHGTGTALGDPIELRALGAVLGSGRAPEAPLLVGSVKTNLGHLEAAAGVAGLIKVVLSMRHAMVPPTLHVRQPTPLVPWEDLHLAVPVSPTPWRRRDAPRRAGVSSFGFSGTNAHVILEEAPARPTLEDEEVRPELLVWSARSEAAGAALSARYAAWLAEPGPEAREVCAAASQRRASHPYRAAVVGRTRAELAAQAAAVKTIAPPRAGRRSVAFIYGGQGGQWAGMGRDLFRDEPAFRDAVRACDDLVRDAAGWSVIEELHAGSRTAAAGRESIEATQLALFAVQVGLSAMWRRWGIAPAAVAGHSMGEIAAAVAAGAIDLPDAVRLMCERGRLLDAARGTGGMLAAETDEASAASLVLVEPSVSIAAVNGPRAIVLSGPAAALARIAETLTGRDVQVHLLRCGGVAGHSPAVAPAGAALAARFEGWHGRGTSVPWISTVTGARVDGATLDAAYWSANVHAPVRFAAAVRTLASMGCDAFVEVGAHPVLAPALVDQLEALDHPAHIVASLRRDTPARDTMLASLGALYTAGVPIDFDGLYPRPVRSVALPGYPFQRERYWLEAARPAEPLYVEEARADAGVRRLIARLLREFPAEGALAINRPSLAPGVFLDSARAGLFFVNRTAASLTALLFAGPGEAYATAARELLAYGDREQLEVQMFATPDQADRLQEIGLTATVCGAFQCLDDLSRFDLGGRHMRRLRYLVHRYEQAGLVRTDEFHVGHDRSADEALIALIDDWAARKPSVAFHARLVAQIRQGTLAPWYRVFVTVRDARLEGAIMLSPSGRDGSLLDVEFYAGTSAPGCLEYTVVRIIERLRSEGVNRLSLGGTFGAALQPREGHDPAVFQFFQTLRDTGILDGDANYQFKSKFRPATSSMFFCRRAADDVSRLDDVLVMLAGTSGQPALRLEPMRSDDERVRFRAVVPHAAAWIRGHAIGDATIVPGALLIEAALAAVRASGVTGVTPDVLHGCAMHQPLILSGADGRLEIDVARSREGGHVRVCGTAATAATGDIPALMTATLPAASGIQPDAESPYDIDAARARCQTRLSADDFYSALGRRGYRYSGAFTAVREVWRRDGEAVARVNLPEGIDERGWHLHPGLLDACLQVLAAAAPRTAQSEGRVHVLRRVERIAAYRPFPRTVLVHGRLTGGAGLRGAVVADLTVVDERHTRLLDMRGIEAVEVDAPAFLSPRAEAEVASIYEVAWVRETAPRPGSEDAGVPWLLLGDDATTRAVRHTLARHGLSRVLTLDDRSGLGARLESWRASAGPQGIVVNLWGVQGSFDEGDGMTPAGLDAALWRACGSTLEMVQALAGSAGATELWIVTGDTPGIGGHGRGHPASAAAWGLARTIATEHRDLWGGIIEVEAGGPGVQADAIADALVNRARGEEVSMRGGARHVARLRRHQMVSRSDAQRVRADGSYLITGGLGGVGLALAEWLVEQGAGRVVLAGRRGANGPAAAAAAANLAGRGPEIWTRSLDVSDPAAVAALVAECGTTPFALRGVIHAAGVVDDAVLANQDWSRMRRALSAKVDGAWHLHRSTRELPLDWFVLCSSAASILGPAGQGSYAAANACLDGLAHYRRGCGLPAISLNWGAWADVGGATASRTVDRLAAYGVEPLPAASACALFAAALDQRPAQLSLMRVQWDRWRAARGHVPLLGDLAGDAGADTPPAHGVDLESLGPYLRAAVARGLGTEAALIDPERSLAEIGFDSLMAVELRSRLERDCGVRVPIALLFRAGTLRQLTQDVEARLARASAAAHA